MNRIAYVATLAVAAVSFATSAAPAADVERWGMWETALRGPQSGNPYCDVRLSAVFTQGDRKVAVPGFYDGDGTYKIRFMPPAAGQWRFTTQSNAPELSGKSGSLVAGPPTAKNRGPVQVHKTFYLRYADGTPYHQFGTTCYAWVHQTDALQVQTLKTLAASPFNKIRFCVFPKSYEYSRNEPALFAFQKKADGKFDFERFAPAFWRHFERRILDLQELGIEADLILWHPYDRWGFAEMSASADDRYLRYCVARLGALRNVWWSLANEYDLMTAGTKGHRGNKTLADWDRFFHILDKEDPARLLRSIHNCRGFYDHTRPWVSHASLQTSDMHAGIRFRTQFQKPVLYDECKYEGNVPQGWGNLTARQMTQRFWLGTLSGCYVGHGETYKHAQDILWWSKGGVLHGESPRRIQWLKDFMAKAPAFDELRPLGDDKGRYILAKPGEYYLVYCLGGKPQTVQLAGPRPYKVDAIDPWEMTIRPVGTAQPGDFTTAAGVEDVAYRFVPYAPGEKLRPEARIAADVTEGRPPLTVKFSAAGGERVQWDFGDGSTSAERATKHTFDKPGLYHVALAVTDKDGGSAQSRVLIVVDRDPAEPIVRAGFAKEETPALTFHGKASRTPDGGIRLPAGPPWGWVEAGQRPLDDLRRLRSFTISGWLKPDSLQTGAGGNRIVFCLNHDRAGFDLVCHADGRLRLAVNQWPDQVQNDSSPGKLVVGKWTFFAVSYDGTRQTDNVSWHFSAPLDAPGGNPKATLDRKTSYNRGAVDTDLGRLAIGNFNETLRGAGLDRQFRGEIRGLQIFGSRTGGAGVPHQSTNGPK